MYAHQAIEDIKHWEEHMGTAARWYLSGIRGMITRAIKFHAGDIDALCGVFKKDAGLPLFMESDYLRLPYPLIWIDSSFSNAPNVRCAWATNENPAATNTKEAILVQKVTETVWYVAFLTYFSEAKRWCVSFTPSYIAVGGTTKDNAITLSALFKEKVVNEYEDGNIIPFYIRGVKYPPHTRDLIINEQRINLTLLQHTIKLLNCKNITTQNNAPDEALNRARRKRGRQELFTYKTLKLSLPADKQGKRPKGEPTGEHCRIHFCRGHFKEYTADAPLFGRITGLWWWQPHVRGRNRDGIVMKDYEVKTKGQGVVHEMV